MEGSARGRRGFPIELVETIQERTGRTSLSDAPGTHIDNCACSGQALAHFIQPLDNSHGLGWCYQSSQVYYGLYGEGDLQVAHRDNDEVFQALAVL